MTIERLIRSGVKCTVDRAAGKTVEVDGKAQPYDLVIHASTDKVARDGGIIMLDAWADGIAAYQERNPVILWAHSQDQLPIGRALKTEIDHENRALVQHVRFHKETELSREVAKLFELGDLNAWSVGFAVKEERPPTEEERSEAESQGQRLDWVAVKAELYETSACPVPSDTYATTVERAIARAKSRGARMEDVERKWYALKAPAELRHKTRDEAVSAGVKQNMSDVEVVSAIVAGVAAEIRQRFGIKPAVAASLPASVEVDEQTLEMIKEAIKTQLSQTIFEKYGTVPRTSPMRAAERAAASAAASMLARKRDLDRIRSALDREIGKILRESG